MFRLGMTAAAQTITVFTVTWMEGCPTHTIWYYRKKLDFDPYRSISRFDPRKSVVDQRNESH